MKTRFIGGPLHGELKNLGDSPRINVPVREPVVPAYLSADRYWAPYYEAVYERHLLALGNNTRVYVYRLRDMGDDEFMRRVADLIEGCR